MTLTLSEIARIDDSSADVPGAKPARATEVLGSRVTRGTFVRRATVAGVGLGLSTLSLFPAPRKALAACAASGYSEFTILGDCPSGSTGYGCSPACGPSTVYGDACNASNWHKSTGDFRTRPNDCVGGAPPYDGWWWYRNCNCPGGTGLRPFRCHDGCKLVGGTWVSSVCRYTAPGCV